MFLSFPHLLCTLIRMIDEKLASWIASHPEAFPYLGEGSCMCRKIDSILLLGDAAEGVEAKIKDCYPRSAITLTSISPGSYEGITSVDTDPFAFSGEEKYDLVIAPLLLGLVDSARIASFLLDLKYSLKEKGLAYLSFPDSATPLSGTYAEVPVFYDHARTWMEKRYSAEDVIASLGPVGLAVRSIDRIAVPDLTSLVTLYVENT